MGPTVELDNSMIQGSREYWNACAIGYLVDYRNISSQVVQNLVNARWQKRGTIEVSKMGELFVFKCSNEIDKWEIINKPRQTLKELLWFSLSGEKTWYPRR